MSEAQSIVYGVINLCQRRHDALIFCFFQRNRVAIWKRPRGKNEKLPLMLVVHVQVHVKTEYVESFHSATLANANESIKEPGIARFDVFQRQDDPTKFVLVEAYRTADAPAAHKETPHYQAWRDLVAPMMAEPRSSVKYSNLFPADDQL